MQVSKYIKDVCSSIKGGSRNLIWSRKLFLDSINFIYTPTITNTPIIIIIFLTGNG